MDAFFKPILDAVLSQCGLLTLLMLVALIYQTAQVARERKGRDEDRAKIYDESGKAIDDLQASLSRMERSLTSARRRT